MRLTAKVPLFDAETPRLQHTFSFGYLDPVAKILAVGFGRGREPADGDTRRSIGRVAHE